MRMWRHAAALIGALAIGLLVAGGSAEARTRKASGESYKIGAIFSVTGDASSLGIPERDTAKMLEKAINDGGGIKGRPLEIIVEDDRSDQTEALNAAKRLIERDKVLAIIGPSRTGNTMALIGYMEKAEVPLISCAAGIEIVEPVRKWVFKTPQSDRMAVQRIIPYLKSKKIRRIAILSDSTPFGKGGLREMETLLPKSGISIAAREEYGPKDASMESQLTKIRGTRAQAIVCWGTPPGPAIVAKNMKQLGLTIPLICSHGVANATFLNIAGEAANGVMLPAGRLIVWGQIAKDHPQRKLLKSYATSYQQAFNKPADTFGGHAYDAIMLIVQALRAGAATPAQLRDHLEKTKGFVGTGGLFTFSPQDHNGLTSDAFVLVKVAKGKWTMAE